MRKARRQRALIGVVGAMLAIGVVLASASAPVMGGSQPLGAEEHGSLTASRPNQRLIAFLRSPVGVATEALVLVAAGIGWTIGVSRRLGRDDPATGGPSSKRARRRADTGGRRHAIPGALRLLAGLVTGSLLVLPLTFSIVNGTDVFALPKTIGLWAWAAVVGVALVGLFVLGLPPRRPAAVELAAAALLVLTAIATAASVDPALSVVGERLQYQGLLTTLAYLLLFGGASLALTTPGRVRAAAAALVVSSAIAAVYALAQWFDLDPIWSELYKGRVFSTVGQANALAATLGMAIVMSLALVPRLRGSRLVLGIVVAVIGAALVLTFSRGGYVALGVGLAVAAVAILPAAGVGRIRRFAPRVGAATAGVVVALGAVALVWQPAGDLVARVAARTVSIGDMSESSNRAHLDLWAVGVAIAADHPILGTGPDTYPVVFPRYRDTILPSERAEVLAQFRPESPHNVYIAIASGSGLPALVAYLALVAACVIPAVRAARRDIPFDARLALAALLGAVALHLVTNLFATAEPATFAVFWVLLGTLVALSRRLLANSGPAENRAAPAR